MQEHPEEVFVSEHYVARDTRGEARTRLRLNQGRRDVILVNYLRLRLTHRAVVTIANVT